MQLTQWIKQRMIKILLKRDPYDCNMLAIIEWLEVAGHFKAASDLRLLRSEFRNQGVLR